MENPSSHQRKRPAGEPTVATLLGWFCPGAGYLYLGRPLLAVAAFAVIGGLYWLGLRLSAGMTFEYLDPELRSAIAPALSAEVGNLGGFLWQLRHYGFGPGEPRLFPPTMRLGTQLTAISGVLNVCVLTHTHLLARQGDTRRSAQPAIEMAFAWLVPGLGHWMQGRRKRGLLVFLALVGLFVVGTWIAEGTNLSRERHFYYWGGQFLVGLPAILGEGLSVLLGGVRLDREIPWREAGLVMACIGGLLNILAMIDVYAWSEANALGIGQERKHSEERAAPAASVRTSSGRPATDPAHRFQSSLPPEPWEPGESP